MVDLVDRVDQIKNSGILGNLVGKVKPASKVKGVIASISQLPAERPATVNPVNKVLVVERKA